MVSHLLVAASLALAFGQTTDCTGTIEGTVLIASGSRRPAAGAEIVLRVALNGQFVPLAETTADDQGRFVFSPLPLGEQYLYLPGANLQGIHYPGRRIRLSERQPSALVTLEVREAASEPSPLVARRHEIIIRPQPEALEVTERILIDNPSDRCYVGQTPHDEAEPVTLELSIPSDFERTTFEKEFFGRRFSLIGGKLVTGVPWQPGSRELAFTYVLRNQQTYRQWRRPLDMPCSDLTVRVRTAKPDEVSCNLGLEAVQGDGEVIYHSDDPLPAGHVLCVELGHLPLGLMTYGRWLAPLLLLALIGGATLATLRRRRGPENEAVLPPSPASEGKKGVAPRRRSRKTRRKRNPSLRRAA